MDESVAADFVKYSNRKDESLFSWSRENSEFLRSDTSKGREAATLEIINDSPDELILNWVTREGTFGNERKIKKGQPHFESTFVGDAFLLRDSYGYCLCSFRACRSGRHELIVSSTKDIHKNYKPFSTSDRPYKLEEIEYEQQVIAGFVCEIDQRLLNSKLLDIFCQDVCAAKAKLPPNCAHALIRFDTRFIVNASTRKDLVTMCYHPQHGIAWLKNEGLSPRFVGCIHLYCLENYCRSRNLWGLGGSLVHELAHAYHDKILYAGHKNELICTRYNCAKELYSQVKVKPNYCLAEHYACTNPAEFFAELSVAFLETSPNTEYNKWEPFNRSQLNSIDPETCKLLSRAWLDMDTLEPSFSFHALRRRASIFSGCLRAPLKKRPSLRGGGISCCLQRHTSLFNDDSLSDRDDDDDDLHHVGAPPQPDTFIINGDLLPYHQSPLLLKASSSSLNYQQQKHHHWLLSPFFFLVRRRGHGRFRHNKQHTFAR
uniref:Uncharacterized protein n=2 Tax=Aureoumbra lagunensis TaxID=44058 RepID=A0A7S3JY77_9STRA|mmetsp:Transcript_1022/g.1274  ORF Transcript_1022/g.1274 Transcript_1022/m.1274 type:complete len:487 (-) Transcript_1022:92-1552(-)